MAKQADQDYIVVNNELRINYLPTKHLTVGHLLEPIVQRLNFMSCSAIIAAAQEAVNCMIEAGIDNRHVHDVKETLIDLRRMRTDWGASMYLSEYPGFRERLIRMICEWVLRAEDMGSLHGFSYVATSRLDGGVQVTGILQVNPELQSIRNK